MPWSGTSQNPTAISSAHCVRRHISIAGLVLGVCSCFFFEGRGGGGIWILFSQCQEGPGKKTVVFCRCMCVRIIEGCLQVWMYSKCEHFSICDLVGDQCWLSHKISGVKFQLALQDKRKWMDGHNKPSEIVDVGRTWSEKWWFCQQSCQLSNFETTWLQACRQFFHGCPWSLKACSCHGRAADEESKSSDQLKLTWFIVTWSDWDILIMLLTLMVW